MTLKVKLKVRFRRGAVGKERESGPLAWVQMLAALLVDHVTLNKLPEGSLFGTED